MDSTYCRQKQMPSGSALIMTVVITVLLAVIGSIFVLMARVEKAASSARTDDEELKLAVDSISEDISQVLTSDVPGTVDPNTNQRAEFYDYPGEEDIWLANIEPYDTNSAADNIRWRQISDLYDQFEDMNSSNLQIGSTKRELICDHAYKQNYSEDGSEFVPADADGDGIIDSRWVKVPDLTTSKGQDVYAALRIIDNCGMININSAYKFDANSTVEYEIDGSTVAQIDLRGMAQSGDKIKDLQIARTGSDTSLSNFWGVTYRAPSWIGAFDISTELDLRNRFFLNPMAWSRFESVWPNTTGGPVTYTYDARNGRNYDEWFNKINQSDPNSDTRHLLTAVSRDRVIGADGDKAYSINRAYSTAHAAYTRIRKAVDPSLKTGDSDYKKLDAVYAQVAANLYDYRDDDSEVSGILDRQSNWHYGYERPCIWISELTTKTWMPKKAPDPNDPNSSDPNVTHADVANARVSFAIEIFKQHETMDNFKDWRLVIDSNNLDANIPNKPVSLVIPIHAIDFNENGRFLVKIWEDPNAVLRSEYNTNHNEWLPANEAVGVDPQAIFFWGPPRDANSSTVGSWKFDFYFGTDPCSMSKVISAGSYATYPGLSAYGPLGSYDYPGDMSKYKKYYWRLDDIKPAPDGNVVSNGQFEFTTGDPSADVNDINTPGTKIFDANTVIRLERPYNVVDPNSGKTDSGWLVVDRVSVPHWLVDHNDANTNPAYITTGVTRSFNRTLHWGRILQRVWDVNGTDGGDTTLGDWNGFYVSDNNDYLWLWPRNDPYDNVGDVALTLRKPVYILPSEDPCIAVGYSAANRLEANVRIDLTDPNMQRMFNYITVLDPYKVDANNTDVMNVYGRINVNTAPWQVLTKLPWVSTRGKEENGLFEPAALAQAIVAYRDKLKIPTTSIDYSQDSGITGGRENGTGLPHHLREALGFESVAELAMVTNKSATDEDYDMWWYAKSQKGDLEGYPDLTNQYWRDYGDGIADDFEERYMIFSRISDICTVRSDVFTAYILVRLGQDGPQRRMIAIFDRSGVTASGGKVKLLALQPVPEVR